LCVKKENECYAIKPIKMYAKNETEVNYFSVKQIKSRLEALKKPPAGEASLKIIVQT